MAAIGQSFNRMGKYERAEWFYRRAQRIAPHDIVIYFCLIENSLNAEDLQNAGRHTERLVANFSSNKIQAQLKVTSTNIFMPHYSQELLVPVITQKLEQMSDAGPQSDPTIIEEKAHLDSNDARFYNNSGNTTHPGKTG